MSTSELMVLLPLLILAATVVIALLVAAFFNHHGLLLGLTLTGLALSFGALFVTPIKSSGAALLVMDGYSTYYVGLILLSAFVVAILSYDYLRIRKEEHVNEYYLTLLLATLGSAILVAANHFASFFLALEILSISLYVLISYRREDARSLEAGTKYLVLAGTSSAFLLFGMALVYASLGTMDFHRMGSELARRPNQDLLTIVGTTLLIAGIGFKLALAPFHLWSPDVYEGAPAPVSGFVATISKGAMFALLLRFFLTAHVRPATSLLTILSLLAAASMFVGNLSALRQNNIKRLLAYSSIAHLGYLLVALLSGAELGASAVAFYLVTYFVTTLIAFGTVSALSLVDRDADRLEDYQGLFWEHPILAAMFSASILSLAGIPLTAGFVGKFYLVRAGVGDGLWALVLILVLNSAIALYYYLRVIVAMFTPSTAPSGGRQPAVARFSGSALAVLSGVLVWLGVYPSPMLHLIQTAMATLAK